MRIFLIALLAAISYAQTESTTLKHIRMLPLGIPEEMNREDMTRLVAAGLNMNRLHFPETRIRSEDSWMYQPTAHVLARARAQDTTVGQYPLGNDEQELRMWKWLKLNGYVKSPESRLLNKAHAKKSAKQFPGMYGGMGGMNPYMFPDMEMKDYLPIMMQMGGANSQMAQAASAAMAYDMEEELLPFYFSSLINQATNNSIANAAASLPFYAMTDMEAKDIYAAMGAGAQRAGGAASGAGVTPSNMRAITNPQALMITSGWSGEDWRQYAGYLMGTTIDGVDTSELAQYQTVAHLTGHDIRKLPVTTGIMPSMVGNFQIPQSVMNLVNQPSAMGHAASAASTLPMLFMEPEDQAQYAAFKRGQYNSNMDQEEIMRYQQYNRMTGGAPVKFNNYPAAWGMSGQQLRKNQEAKPEPVLKKEHQMQPGVINPLLMGMEGEDAIPYLIASQGQQTGTGAGGSASSAQSAAAMAMMMNGESGLGEGDVNPMMMPGLMQQFQNTNGGSAFGNMNPMLAGMFGDVWEGFADSFGEGGFAEGDFSPAMIPGLINYFNSNPVNGVSGNNMASMGMSALGLFGDGIDEEMLPYIMSTAQQGIQQAGSMLPAMLFDGEDMAQYTQYIHGLVTPDMDASEIARYAAMAKQQGMNIPSTAGQIPSYAGMSAARLVGEKARDYNLYINGILTENMDPDEIAMYQQIARATGVTPKAFSYMPTGAIPANVMTAGTKLQKKNPLKSRKLRKPRAFPFGGRGRGRGKMDMGDLMEDLMEDARMMPGRNGAMQMYSSMDADSYINAIAMGMDPANLPIPSEGFDREEMRQLKFVTDKMNVTNVQFPQGFGRKFEVPETEDMMGYYMQQNPGFVNNMMDMAMRYMSDAQNFYNFRFDGSSGDAGTDAATSQSGGDSGFPQGMMQGMMDFEFPGMGDISDMIEDQQEYQMKHGRHGRRRKVKKPSGPSNAELSRKQ